MLSQKTLEKIIHESNNGGVKNNHPELTTNERKYLLNYLLKGGKCLDTCYLCATELVGA
jgi:hypothetical protein